MSLPEIKWPEERQTLIWTVRKGETFIERLRWGVAPFRYVAISAITQPIPLRMTVTDHQLPDRWPVIIVGHPSFSSAKVRSVTVVDANTVEFQIDGSALGAYAGGAFLVSPTPMNMSGYAARMDIKENKTDLVPLLSLASGGQGIIVDDNDKFIEISLTAAQLGRHRA